MIEADGAAPLAGKLTALDEIEVELEARRSGRRRATRIWLAVTISTMVAALPGGVLYALYWGIGYVAAGSVLALTMRRKLRELEQHRDTILAIDARGDAALQTPTDRT